MSKAFIFAPHEAQTSVFWMMDYEQLDKDVCQHHNTLLGGVQDWMRTCELYNIMFLNYHLMQSCIIRTQQHPEQQRKQRNDADKWKAAYQYFPLRRCTSYIKCSAGPLSLLLCCRNPVQSAIPFRFEHCITSENNHNRFVVNCNFLHCPQFPLWFFKPNHQVCFEVLLAWCQC